MPAACFDMRGLAGSKGRSLCFGHIYDSKKDSPLSSRSFPFLLGQPDGRLLEAVASAFKLQQVSPMKETIHDGGGSGVVAQQLAPIFQGPV
jgi:hypothetical protein